MNAGTMANLVTWFSTTGLLAVLGVAGRRHAIPHVIVPLCLTYAAGMVWCCRAVRRRHCGASVYPGRNLLGVPPTLRFWVRVGDRCLQCGGFLVKNVLFSFSGRIDRSECEVAFIGLGMIRQREDAELEMGNSARWRGA